jgi:hypothetical protein
VAHLLLRPALLISEGVELVHEARGLHPAQSMAADVELASIVTDDHGVAPQAMGGDRAPERPIAGVAYRIGHDPEPGRIQPLEMRLPRRTLGECASGWWARRARLGRRARGPSWRRAPRR